MADPEHGNRPADRRNGGGAEPAAKSEADYETEAARTLAEGDQTLADLDQTAADEDQTAADDDEVAAASDQAAADDDQAASDRDFAAGGDPDVHGSSRNVRAQAARQRRMSADARAATALTRDSVAEARDLAAAARDQAAAKLDRELDRRDGAASSDDQSDGRRRSVAHARENRDRAAADRVLAAKARNRAAADREQAAGDRMAAAEDRRQAHEDREALVRELAVSELDALTGARTRGPGLADLDHEIDRARRTTGGLLAVAYVDLVGLKEVNNERGHSAGDALLREAVKVIRAHLRSYDVIVRVGGDEFVCVLSGAGMEDVRERFEAVQRRLAAAGGGCKIKFGLAKLTPGDTGTALIDRADAEMQRRG